MNNKYNIHPDFQKLPAITLKFSPFLTGLLNGMMIIQRALGKRSPTIEVARHRVASSHGGHFNIITMTPHTVSKSAPVLVYYHGGAFALTYGKIHLQNVERYASETGCIVVFVDYRLAPKHPFPCGFNDCYTALQWTLEQAESLGIDKQRIVVGGDSAGGALAAGVAQKARDEKLIELCGQLLIYPVLDYRCDTESATQFVDTPLWNATSNRRMWQMYLSAYPAGDIPDYASPGHGTLTQSPLTYIETAEFDPLRDEALHYARALQQQAIELTLNETKGTVHGYDGIATSASSQQAIASRIAFLKQAFQR